MKISTIAAIALLASTSTLVAQGNSKPTFIFRSPGTVSATAPSTPTDPETPGTPEIETISASIPGGTFTVGDTVNITGTVSGNSEPVVWTVASGSLGSLTLSSSGVISGVASASGTFSAVLNVANSKASTTANVTLTVNATPLNVAANGGEFFAIKGQAITPHTINVTGGTAPYTSEFDSSEFPSGISVSGLTVSGTAGAGVTATDYEPIITVKDSGGQSGASLFKIKVRDVLTLSAATPDPIYRGINYTHGVSASGGQSPQIALANPAAAPGLSFNGNTLSGQISSVPNLNSATGIGSTTLQFTATDETGQTANLSRTFEIWDLPSFTVSGSTSVVGGNNVSLVLTPKAAVDGATFTASNLPSGLSVSGNTISGKVNVSVSGNITSQVRIRDGKNREVVQNVSFTVTPPPPLVLADFNPITINAGQTANVSFSLTGGNGDYSVQSVAPANPIVSINFATKTMSIRPLAAGDYIFTFQDSNGYMASKALRVNINDF